MGLVTISIQKSSVRRVHCHAQPFHAILNIDEISVGAALVDAQERQQQDDISDNNQKRATTRVAPTDRVSLSQIIGAFKSKTTNYYIEMVHKDNWPPFEKRLWQRNYYEHIIRNQRSLDAIREYILNNPVNWPHDPENPSKQL